MKSSKIILTIVLLTLWVSGLCAEEIFLQQCEEFLTSENNAVGQQNQCAEDSTSTRWLALSQCTVKEQNHSQTFISKWVEFGQSFFRSELDRLLTDGERAFKEADYSTALKIFKEGLHKAQTQGKRDYIAGFFNAIAAVHNAKGEYQQAKTHYNHALKINPTGSSLTGLGAVYDNLGQYEDALKYHKQALSFYRKIKNLRGEGGTLTNIGLVHLKRGEYQQAEEYLQQALKIQCNIKEIHEVGKNLSNIGMVYRNLGQYQKAFEYLQKALSVRCQIGDRSGIGETLTNIGNVYGNRGEYQKALDYYKKALAISCEIGKKRSISTGFNNLGDAYNNLRQYQKALKYFEYAIDIDRKIHNEQGEAIDLISLGEAYRNLKQYHDAKVQFEKSVTILKDLDSRHLWKAQSGLAFVETKLNQPESAIQYYEQALYNIEKLRAGITLKEHKISFMRQKLHVYDELIALLQSLHSKYPHKHYDRKAIEIFERKQGRLFLEEMGQSGARRFTGLPNDIIQQEQTLAQQWQQKSRSPEEWQALEQAQAKFETMLAQKHPKYHALKYPQPVDLATLQNQVLQQGEMVLVYNVISEYANVEIESKTILWVIGKKQFKMFTLPLDENTLAKDVAQFREFIVSDGWVIGFVEACKKLSQKLLPKAARQLLVGTKTLYIVPTGVLYGVPFEALLNTPISAENTPRYLVQDYAIAYLSSASLLKTLRETKRQEQPPEPLLAFADPVYQACPQQSLPAEEDSFMGLRTKSYLKIMKDGCFTRLKDTADEVLQIADVLKADKNKAIYLGEKASRSTVFALNDQQQLDDYRYIMFSVHGILPGEVNQITQPALVLSNPLTEGYLTMADAFALKLNADFVNLSACNTGRGELIRGEGIRGLTRAFMYAGTPATAVTLWSVRVDSAKHLSIQLFKKLQAGQKLAHALRATKLEMIENAGNGPDYSHPHHWAGFVIYGLGQ